MIKVQGLAHHYGVRPVLQDVSFEVAAGEVLAVMGPNGIGKTTLLMAVAGALSPVAGQVFIGGHLRKSTPEEELAARRLTFYLPDQSWIPSSTLGRDWLIAIGRLYDVAYERLFAHVEQLLDLFQLRDKADSLVSSYSAGQRRKLELAAVLISDAPLLVLDEPFSGGLDPSGLLVVKSLLRRFAETRERTVVLATPVPELVAEVATRVLVLLEGRTGALDTPETLIARHAPGGTLADVYAALSSPQTKQDIERYLETSRP